MRPKHFFIAAVMTLFFTGAVFAQTEDGDFYYYQGTSYFEQNDYISAIESFLKLKEIHEQTTGKETPKYATTLVWLGFIYFNMGDYSRAEPYYLEALGIWAQILGKNNPSYAAFLNDLGTLYFSMGDYSKAEKYCLEAFDIVAKALGKDHPNYAISLNNMGVLYNSLGDYFKAETYQLEALEITARVLGKEHPDYANAVNSLGGLYDSMGNYEAAEKYYLEALNIRARVLGRDHPDYAASLSNLGGLYGLLGNYEAAVKYNLLALDILAGAFGKDHPEYATGLNSLGVLYNSIGDYETAEKYFLEALGIRAKVLSKDHPFYAVLLDNLGSLYDNMGDYSRSEAYYLEALDIRARVLGKNHLSYATSLNNLGILYCSMGDFSRAEKYILESLGTITPIIGKDHPDYVGLLSNLGLIYLSEKKYAPALELKKEESTLHINQVNKSFSFLSEQERNNYWYVHSFFFELGYSLSHFYPVPESTILDYDNTLFTKGLLLRTANAVRDSIYSSGNEELISQFEELGRTRQQISALRQNSGAEAFINELEEKADALDKSLTQASAAYREFQAEFNWKDVQNSLGPKEAAIEFISFGLFDIKWTNKMLYAALVLRPGMHAPVWIQLCEETELAELFKKAAGMNVLEQARIIYDESGSDLYRAIWQPLEKALEGAATVYYSPSGLLHKVAFNAIPAGGGKRLMDKYDLHLVSSTREIVNIKRKTSALFPVMPRSAAPGSAAPRSAAIYGGILYDADESSMKLAAAKFDAPAVAFRAIKIENAGGEVGWDFLKASVPESEDIAGFFAKNKIPAELWSGSAGNEESFKALSGKKTAVIHLATHGFFLEDLENNNADRERLERLGGNKKAPENPLLRSGLILAGANNAWLNKPVEGVEDGILFAAEAANLNLVGTELVVLSACETALGTVNNSEGVFGLQRAFKLAGVNTIIMSLWKVSDEATSIFMRVFYQNWLAGKSKSESFREAQRTLRESREFSAPVFWAAFVMLD